MKKLKIHPLFLLIVALMVLFRKSLVLVNALFAVIMHEWMHVKVAYYLGYQMDDLMLMPYGGTVTATTKIEKHDDIVVSLIGPISNLGVASILVAFWWILPESYYFTQNLVYANMTIGIFNLIPAYPLDMSRVILAISNNKKMALKVMRVVGIIIGVFSLGFFVVSIFYTIVPSLLIVGITMLFSATFGISKESQMNSVKKVGVVKNFEAPLEKKTVLVDIRLPLSRLMRLLSPSTVCVFEVVNGNNLVRVLTESQVIEWSATYPRNTILRDLVK